MKQYIDSCGPGVVVALDNRAFVILSPTTLPTSSCVPPISYELLAPPNNNKNNNNNNNNNKNKNNSNLGNGKKSKRRKDKDTPNEKKIEEEEVVDEEKVDNTARKDDKTDNITNKFGIKYQQDTNAIQVVACRWMPETSILYCAVSRFDKSISIYNIPTTTAAATTTTIAAATTTTIATTTTTTEIDNNGKDEVNIKPIESTDEQGKIKGQIISGMLTIKPMLVHKVPKRSCTLAFATVPSLSPSVTSSVTPSPPPSPPPPPQMLVVIAGDLAGDATAFPVQPYNPTDNNTQISRLMLGHTASMLTSIKLIPQQTHNDADATNTITCGGKILTADRDEKVRISSFPNTFHIQGYLLGHSAYITDIDLVPVQDATNQGKQFKIQYCVTASGDGTVRLWDIHTCAELCRIDYLAECRNHCTDNTINDDDDDDDDDDDSMDIPNNDEEQQIDDTTKKHMLDNAHRQSDALLAATTPSAEDIDHAPVRVSVNKDGTILAVMRDRIDRIELFHIAVDNANGDGGTTGTLTKFRSIECPSYPLGMTFASDGSLSVLTREPTFIVRWTPLSLIAVTGSGDDSNSTDVTGEEKALALTTVSVSATSGPSLNLESCTIGKTIQNIGIQLNITMPYTLLEANESTGKVKLRKNIQEEKEGFVKYEPWLSVERVEKAKQRGLRSKKRKREKTRLLGS